MKVVVAIDSLKGNMLLGDQAIRKVLGRIP